jgi:hypothetical protein
MIVVKAVGQRVATGGTGIGDRITVLETWSTQFERSVRGEFEDIRTALATGFREVKASLIELERERRPNLQLWVGIAGLTMTLVGGAATFLGIVGGLAIRNISTESKAALALVETRFVQADRVSDGDRKQLHREISVVKDTIATLDATLQREMRDLDATRDVALEALDARIQGEIGRSAAFDTEFRAETNEKLDQMLREVNAGHRTVSANTERLRAVERAVFGERARTP